MGDRVCLKSSHLPKALQSLSIREGEGEGGRGREREGEGGGRRKKS